MANCPLKYPRPLITGDVVALTAPASPVSSDDLERAIRSLEFLGLKPVIMPCCCLSQSYLSGPDWQRAEDLNRAFSNPRIKGIFCIRGGYGSARLLPLLDWERIKKNPKVFAGYSDITALHLAINQRCGFVTYHSPMPGRDYRRMDTFSLESLKTNLFSLGPAKAVPMPADSKPEVIVSGKARGILIGGNLSVIQSTLGSPYEIDTKGKILFLEDVGEELYRLDRAFTSLALAGKFRDCAGILLGTFTHCPDLPDNSGLPREMLEDLLKPWGKPVLASFCAGHSMPHRTLALGGIVSLNGDVGALRFE